MSHFNNQRLLRPVGSIDQIDGSGSKSANTGICFFCKNIKSITCI